MRCIACNQEAGQLYSIVLSGPLYCGNCFGMKLPEYVGGDELLWVRKLWDDTGKAQPIPEVKP